MFDEEELIELKTKISDLVNGKIQTKQLKQSLLQYRGRMVNDLSSFLNFCLDRVRDNYKNRDPQKIITNSQSNFENIKLHKEIAEKDELLETVAKRINTLLSSPKSQIQNKRIS